MWINKNDGSANHSTSPIPYASYKGEHVQFVQRFKYLGTNLHATNKWSVRFESRFQAAWKSYYMLENKCKLSDAHGWQVKLMLFNTMVTQVLLYGSEVQGDTISFNAWNGIDKIQRMFLADNWELNPPPLIKLCSWKLVFDLQRNWSYIEYIDTLISQEYAKSQITQSCLKSWM